MVRVRRRLLRLPKFFAAKALKDRGEGYKCLRVPYDSVGVHLHRAFLMFHCPLRDLLDQTRSWNQHIPHLAIQTVSNAGKSS